MLIKCCGRGKEAFLAEFALKRFADFVRAPHVEFKVQFGAEDFGANGAV